MKFLTVAAVFFTAVLAAPGNYPPPPPPTYAPPPPTYTLPPNGNGGGNGNGNGNGNGGGNGNGNGNTNTGGSALCPAGLYSNPQSCATDVLGLADLDCAVPSTTPHDGPNFQSICVANGGKRARCCVLPVLGLGVLCQNPVGTN
uniref:Class II hydrophobin qid3 n=1 Tax=Trichoderma harzianum TaxID=5544 RepID=QID3_TRIHA|nr:RecName: Full=Cell wall protein qid3; Flags: Precursor [Trichoderma harzianum]CAA50728.1 QID3 [Trichoderma lixii]